MNKNISCKLKTKRNELVTSNGCADNFTINFVETMLKLQC